MRSFIVNILLASIAQAQAKGLAANLASPSMLVHPGRLSMNPRIRLRTLPHPQSMVGDSTSPWAVYRAVRAARQEPPGATRSHQESPGGARSPQEPPRGTRRRQEPPGATTSYQEPAAATRNTAFEYPPVRQHWVDEAEMRLQMQISALPLAATAQSSHMQDKVRRVEVEKRMLERMQKVGSTVMTKHATKEQMRLEAALAQSIDVQEKLLIPRDSSQLKRMLDSWMEDKIEKDLSNQKFLGKVTTRPSKKPALGLKDTFAKIKKFFMQKRGVLSAVRRAMSSPYAALYLVPLLWASYGPMMRGIYALDSPPASSTLTAIRSLIIAGLFLVSEKLQRNVNPGAKEGASLKPSFNKMTMTKYALILGVLNFLGTSAQTDALATIEATRSAFLVSMKTVLVPTVAALEGNFLPTTANWVASAVALAGTSLMLLGKGGEGNTLVPHLSFGDIESLFAALCFALNTVVWGKALKTLPQAELLTRKNTIYAGLCMLWVAYDFLTGTKALWPNAGWTNIGVWVGILAASVFPGFLSGIFQAKAQSTIPPQEAQIAYTLTPVFTAMFGMLLLNEKLAPLDAAGAAMAVGAAFISSSMPSKSNDAKDKEQKESPK